MIRCQNCSFNHLCLPPNLSDGEMHSLDAIIKRDKPLHKGELLVTAGDDFTALFAVRSGSFKTYHVSIDGEQQITGFHLPGDVMGMNALSGSHQSYIVALETSMVCEVPYEQFDQMTQRLPRLKTQIMALMSNEIRQDKDIMLMLNKRTAIQRICYFLLELSQRYSIRGFSDSAFNLPMTRGDIGNHLGLTLETTSRLFSKLQSSGIIEIQGKLLHIRDKQALQAQLDEVMPFSIRQCG